MEQETLKKFRDSLLELHSSILAFQKHEYEEDNRQIQSPAEYFNLVTQDPAFVWLRQISQVVVSLDEALEKMTEGDSSRDAVLYVKNLLNPSSVGNEFSEKYKIALSKSPDVALKHGKVMEFINQYDK